MLNRTLDNSASAVALTSPLWSLALDKVNEILTALSLVLGIAFLLWRWWRLAKVPASEDKE